MTRAEHLRHAVQAILRTEGGVAVPAQLLYRLRQSGEDVLSSEVSAALTRLRQLGLVRRAPLTGAMRRRVRKQGLRTTATWMYALTERRRGTVRAGNRAGQKA